MEIKERKLQTFFRKTSSTQMDRSNHLSGNRFNSLIELASTHFSPFRIRQEQTMKVEKLLSIGLS